MSNDHVKAAGQAPEPGSEPELSRLEFNIIAGVRVTLEAKLGEAPMTVEELMALKPGAVVALETALADQIELYMNNTLVALGEIVAVGDKYGVRIIELATRP